MKWMSLVKFGLILLICLMPVLGSWTWTLLMLGLLFFFERPKPRLWGWEFGLLGLIIGISVAVSTGFRPGWKGSSIHALLQVEGWILMAWLTSRSISRELGEQLLRFLVLSSLFWIFLGFRQLAIGMPTNPDWLSGDQSQLIPVRIFSVFKNPNIYALYLLGIFILAVEIAVFSPPFGRRREIGCLPESGCRPNNKLKAFVDAKIYSPAMYGVIAGLALLSLYFTYSRMAWLLAGAFGFFRLIGRFKWRGLLVSGATFLGMLSLPAFRARLGGLIFFDSSLLYRTRIWRGVIRALGDYWIWGAGPGSFSTVYRLFQLGNTPAQHAHQLYLQIWLEYGIFGLGAFVYLVVQLLRKHDFPGLRAILFAFLGYGFSETWYLNHDVGGFFWLAAGLLGAAPEGSPNRFQQQEPGQEKEERIG